MVQTPVGAKCRACAQVRRLPMFELGPIDYLKVSGIALGAAIGCGVALTLMLGMVPFLGILRLLLMAGLGYVVSEAILKFSRKRGNVVGIIAALAAVIGVIVGPAALFIVGGGNPVLALVVAASLAFRDLWSILSLAVAAAVAYSRVR